MMEGVREEIIYNLPPFFFSQNKRKVIKENGFAVTANPFFNFGEIDFWQIK